MNYRKPLLAALAASTMALGGMALVASPAVAATQSYEATLAPLNGSSASGTLMLTLDGNQATITEKASGLPQTFGGNPYPHVQHIHINGQGTCPAMSADTNGDGVISTTEGAPAYGPIGTTLSTSGPTTAAAGTVLTIAPSGATIDYSRTIMLDAATVSAIQNHTAVIVVHGLDPTTLSTQAQAEKSELVPSLPLAATSPALCGALTAAQTTAVPAGGAQTGLGGTSGTEDGMLFVLGGSLLAGSALFLGLRRKLATVR
jgi:hypothetical protein